MKLIIGVLYCYLWFASILAGYLCLYCPILPLLLISNKLYRYCTDVIFTFWQAYPTVLLHLLCRCDVQVTGDCIQPNEMSILVMNHRTRTDWNFLWPALYHSTKGINKYQYSTKFLLKDAVRHIPGPGWVMQLTSSIFIRRSWSLDKDTLQNFSRYIAMLSYKCCILIFPEGTDFTEDTRKKSDSFAEKENLKKYKYILHPRTTGFTFLASQLLDQNCLDAVYDLTLVYPDFIPQTEMLLLRGNFPRKVIIHIVRYPKSKLPKSDHDFKKFLLDRWKEKENNLEEYHNGRYFSQGPILRCENSHNLLFALIFWTIVPYIAVYFLIYHSTFRHICLAHTVFLIAVNFSTSGFQHFEIMLYSSEISLFEYVNRIRYFFSK